MVETVDDGGIHFTVGTQGKAENLVEIHWGTASRTFGGVESNNRTTTGTTDLMGYIIWGVEYDEDGSRLQANEAMGRTEIGQKR